MSPELICLIPFFPILFPFLFLVAMKVPPLPSPPSLPVPPQGIAILLNLTQLHIIQTNAMAVQLAAVN